VAAVFNFVRGLRAFAESISDELTV